MVRNLWSHDMPFPLKPLLLAAALALSFDVSSSLAAHPHDEAAIVQVELARPQDGVRQADRTPRRASRARQIDIPSSPS